MATDSGPLIPQRFQRQRCNPMGPLLSGLVQLACTLGPGCLLAMLDLKEAYRAVPVHPSDQPLLEMAWQGTTYTDRALPFGLRSAPKIFSALTDAMMWILWNRGIVMAVHYLDDFLLLGPPASPPCSQALASTISLCKELGFPVTADKTEGPGSTLTFLGVEIDSIASEIC